MIIFKTIDTLNTYLLSATNRGLTIGFVPTMGALHKGHLSLIDMSKKSTQKTVCSIFVNPTQFNDSNDFDKYPSTIESDILLLPVPVLSHKALHKWNGVFEVIKFIYSNINNICSFFLNEDNFDNNSSVCFEKIN